MIKFGFAHSCMVPNTEGVPMLEIGTDRRDLKGRLHQGDSPQQTFQDFLDDMSQVETCQCVGQLLVMAEPELR
jgi:hypothetical protein